MKSRLTSVQHSTNFEVFNQRAMNPLSMITMSEKTEELTRRETEILYFMSQGKTSKEIASCLSISAQTVQKHTKNIYQKLNVHNKIEALNKTRWLIASLYGNRN